MGILILASALCCCTLDEQPQRLFFIGNSLTASNDLPHLVQSLFVTLKKPKPVVETQLQGGASLGDHWQNPAVKQRIITGRWDYIILQQGPTSVPSSHKELLQDMATVKPWLVQAKTKPCLFMVWPETQRHRVFPQVRNGYAKGAQAVDGTFLPAGLALQYVREKAPGIELFTDGFHPNANGTYLAALVIAAKLTGSIPEKVPGNYTWKEHAVKLSASEQQLFLDAVRHALKDEGK